MAGAAVVVALPTAVASLVEGATAAAVAEGVEAAEFGHGQASDG